MSRVCRLTSDGADRKQALQPGNADIGREQRGQRQLKGSSTINVGAFQLGLPHLVAVMHGGDYLSKEVAGLPLAQAPALADVVVELALAGILHHNHDLVLVLKHCEKSRDQLDSVHTSVSRTKSKLMEGNRTPAG